jgi:hypothetical protein
VANRNFSNGGKLYQMHSMPVLVDVNFVVDSTNGNGLGIRSLKSSGMVDNVFMHTSAPLAGSGNPNPEAGIIVVQLADNYNRSLSGWNSIISPIGTPTTSTTASTPATVISLGTSTQANWLAVGFPPQYLSTSTGLPTIGATFIPTSSGAIGGGATVAPPATAGSGITSIETIGDPNATISSNQPQTVGAQIVLQTMASGTLTAPANGTVISLSFMLNNSSVIVGGE